MSLVAKNATRCMKSCDTIHNRESRTSAVIVELLQRGYIPVQKLKNSLLITRSRARELERPSRTQDTFARTEGSIHAIQRGGGISSRWQRMGNDGHAWHKRGIIDGK